MSDSDYENAGLFDAVEDSERRNDDFAEVAALIFRRETAGLREGFEPPQRALDSREEALSSRGLSCQM